MTQPKIILHVDDDPDDRFLVSDVINSIDPAVIVREAENGLIALDLLKKARIIGELPSLVILDFNMPIMNGMETYKEIRKLPEFCQIPVVLLTTFSNKREDSFWGNENVATFTKPSTFSELTASIREILTILRIPK